MKVGVIGAGTMGVGIAQAFAQNDKFEVVLCSRKEESAASGKCRIEKNLNRSVKKGRITQEEMNEALARVTTGLMEKVSDCEMIVEAVAENMEIKKQIFQQLEEICKESTIFTTTTSSLSVTELSGGLNHKVIGMHFFNPVSVMKLVEVVAGIGAPTELAAQVKSIAEEIGKVPVEVKENAGFIVNRILIPMINEGIGIYAAGTASKEDIDTAMKLGANHPMGPLELGDLIGLDVCLAIMEVLYSETGDSRYRAEPLLRQMVRSGLLGQKTGKGFYEYGEVR